MKTPLAILLDHLPEEGLFMKVKNVDALIINAMKEYANQEKSGTKQCMYCEKTVDYSSGIFTCEDCSK